MTHRVSHCGPCPRGDRVGLSGPVLPTGLTVAMEGVSMGTVSHGSHQSTCGTDSRGTCQSTRDSQHVQWGQCDRETAFKIPPDVNHI